MCSRRARLTAGETKVAEQPDQSTPAPAHLVLATSHLGSRHHSQSQRSRKCRNYDWQEEHDQRERQRPTAEKEGAAELGFHLEQTRARSIKRKNSAKDVNHIRTHTHCIILCNVCQSVPCFWKPSHTERGDVSENKRRWANECSNTCKQISMHLRLVRNPPWALSQHVPGLKQTCNSHTNTHTQTAALIYHWLGQYRDGWQELVRREKNGRITGGGTVPLATFNTQKMP